MKFTVTDNDQQSRARTGLLETAHGVVETPAFMPVGTRGAVKALSPRDLREVSSQIILCNTYHLYLRPGEDLIRDLGGLHGFMGWDRPILTDSGGYQVFSLGAMVRVTDDEVVFRSHLDGGLHRFTPEAAVRSQERLGVDVMMCLDHLVAADSGTATVRQAMERTHRWAARCREAWREGGDQALFGIVQGGVDPALRGQSARFLVSLDFPGYAIGGLAVGETKARTYETVALTAGLLPADRPRYLMGVGSPEDLVECVARGVDMFDCALPTRVARNGAMFTAGGRVNATAARYADARGPAMDGCDCYACANFSLGYIHHLFRAKELLALRLASIHNLRFTQRLMNDMRSAILEGRFEAFAQGFLAAYRPTSEARRMDQKRRWIDARKRA